MIFRVRLSPTVGLYIHFIWCMRKGSNASLVLKCFITSTPQTPNPPDYRTRPELKVLVKELTRFYRIDEEDWDVQKPDGKFHNGWTVLKKVLPLSESLLKFDTGKIAVIYANGSHSIFNGEYVKKMEKRTLINTENGPKQLSNVIIVIPG